MTEVTIVVVDHVPVPQGSKRIGLNRKTGAPVLIDDNPKLRVWRHVVTMAAQEAMGDQPRFEGPVTVDATFLLPRPKTVTRRFPTAPPDLDKLLRSWDALTGVVWVDDAQVVGLVGRKLYCAGAEEAGCTLVVRMVP